jgi:hypothetical protein
MLLNWVVVWKELDGRNRERRCDPMADPLDRPEWKAFQWLVPLIAWIFSRAPPGRRGRIRDPFRNSAAARGAEIRG